MKDDDDTKATTPDEGEELYDLEPAEEDQVKGGAATIGSNAPGGLT